MAAEVTTSTARIKLSPSFWAHDLSVPLGSDLAPASLFQKNEHFLIVDVETKTLVDAVGGWKNFKALEISVACAYDSKTDKFLSYTEDKLGDLCKLCEERLVIGYNIKGFDLPVMEKYGLRPEMLDTFDIMLDVANTSGWKFIKLEKIASATLGAGKSADGLQAVEWWKEGKIDKIIEYCLRDVEVTRDVFLYGQKNGHILIQKANDEKAQFPVSWT
jgi:DEAD/DEAH box helicase domain-containing protein